MSEPHDLLVYRGLERRQLGPQIDRVLEQLRRGDFRSAEVKKLRGSGLYRARLDEKNRLLFRIGEHRGRRLLLVLEVIHNHAYDRSRFLGGGSCGEDDFVPLSAEPEASEKLAFVHPTSPALHVLDRPLSFDDAQAAVFAAPLPLVVIGSAGSGKTALTLEKLKELPGHGLYLTRSSYLVENARRLYFAQGYANDGQEVEFLSLAELLQTLRVPEGREATWRDFAAWFARMRGGFPLREPHKLFEEIKGVLTGGAASGPFLTLDEYLALGVRQSIFLGEERRAAYQVFERWRAHLAESGLFDAGMAAFERLALAAPTYDFLVIDEVQDVTPVELRLALATLRDRRAFVLSGDSNQIVHPNLFSWARVRAIFHEAEEAPAQIHVLSANYRNTRAVTALANRLLRVKQRRFGSVDRESNFLVDCVSDEPGRVDLLADSPAVRAELDARTRRSAHHAVIVLRDDDKPAAREAFHTPLVFSVQEAKGLEYEHVVLFNLVSSAPREFRTCAEGVSPGDLEGELSYARAADKTDKSLEAYKFHVNALYVAMTRAVRSLLLVESDPSHPLLDLLAVERASQVEMEAQESSREEWQAEARKLELQGKTEQAEAIRRDLLGTQPVPWTVLDRESFAAVREKALGKRDKAAQQLLFEHALTCGVPQLLQPLVDAGFRHASKPESGWDYIASTHHADYRFKRSPGLQQKIARHGVDFRNPLSETPLMVAARVGRADLVEELLAQGADPDLTDPAGRTALRVALASFLDAGLKGLALEAVWRLLAGTPLKVKLGSRMRKLDPHTMEWFLLQYALVQGRRGAARRRAGTIPAFGAPDLARVLSYFPRGVVPLFRQQRAYLSSMLSKNELGSTSPYNRQLFVRAARGSYVVNPALEIEHRGAFVPVGELMGLPQLFEAIGAEGESLRTWLDDLAARVRAAVRERDVGEPMGAASQDRTAGAA